MSYVADEPSGCCPLFPATDSHHETVVQKKHRVVSLGLLNQKDRRQARTDMVSIPTSTASVATSANELSKLLPGYTAPLKLTSTSLDKYRCHGGLVALRRQALREDPSSRGNETGSNEQRKHITSILQSKANSPTVQSASFKKGTKRLKPTGAGAGWFGMRPTPMTDEVKRDLALIRNRNYLDPKRFYKSADSTGQVVQVGTVIEGASEYYSSRLTKKQRRSNLVDEILADPSSSDYAQKKYLKMQQEKSEKAKMYKKSRRGKK